MTLIWERDRPRSQSVVRPRATALPATLLVAAFFVLTAVAWAAPAGDNEVIVPNAAARQSAPPIGGTGAVTLVVVILLAGAGAWMLWRGRGSGLVTLKRTPRQLAVEETRSLGNRQYLVVAAYQNRKFLLGVCPGRIDLLAPLTESTPVGEKRP